MKVNRETLLRELRFVARAADRAPEAHSVLKHALWRVRDGALMLQATDTEMTLTSRLDLDEAPAELELTVPAAASVSILSDMHDESVELELDGKDWRVRDSAFNSRLSGLPPDEWPEAPEIEDSVEAFAVPSGKVLRALGAVKHSAGRSGRYAAGGSAPIILVLRPDGDFTAAAAHEHRAAVSGNYEDLKSREYTRIGLRLEDAAVLEAFGEIEGEWKIRADGRRAEFRSGGRTASIRLPEGSFPNIPSLIENLARSLEHSFKVNRERFQRVARVAASCPGIEESTVVAEIKDGEMELVGRGAWSEVRGKCPVTVEGPDARLGFTGSYLVDLTESLAVKDLVVKYPEVAGQGKPVYHESENADGGKEWRIIAGKIL